MDERDNGSMCQGCDHRYKVDIEVSGDIWERIKPEGKAQGAGLLCGRCILSRIEALGTYGDFTLTGGNVLDRIRRLEAALTSIQRAAPACECEHDNEYCCAVVGEFCGYCWAHAALISSANSSPSDAEELMELRKVCQEAFEYISYIYGPKYEFARRLQRALNPRRPGKETQG